MEEMVHSVDHDFHEHFPLVFRKLCECTCQSFGIEMREVCGPGHSIELVHVVASLRAGGLAQ